MKNREAQLQKELRQAGASAAEIAELAPIAARLGSLRTSAIVTKSTKKQANHMRKMLRSAIPAALGLALGMLLVIASQTALPTSLLYPVQKLSDSVAMSFYPPFRASVMMQRAQQVNRLVANHADSQKILSTLADYTRVASAYKSAAHTNYAAFEYCKANLQQAATATTSPAVRHAIASSLQSLETI